MSERSVDCLPPPARRERLYEELVQASHRERQGAAGVGAQGREFGRNANLSYGLEGGPMSVPLSVGQKQVARVHPLSGVSGGKGGKREWVRRNSGGLVSCWNSGVGCSIGQHMVHGERAVADVATNSTARVCWNLAQPHAPVGVTGLVVGNGGLGCVVRVRWDVRERAGNSAVLTDFPHGGHAAHEANVPMCVQGQAGGVSLQACPSCMYFGGLPCSVALKLTCPVPCFAVRSYVAQMFTQFDYLPSEYDRVKLKGKFERLQHRLNQVGGWTEMSPTAAFSNWERPTQMTGIVCSMLAHTWARAGGMSRTAEA